MKILYFLTMSVILIGIFYLLTRENYFNHTYDSPSYYFLNNDRIYDPYYYQSYLSYMRIPYMGLLPYYPNYYERAPWDRRTFGYWSRGRQGKRFYNWRKTSRSLL